MTTKVVSVDEATPISDIAELLEKRHIKRVPVMRNGKPVGIVSRANLVQALATFANASDAETAVDDRKIRTKLLAELSCHKWAGQNPANIVVRGASSTYGAMSYRTRSGMHCVWQRKTYPVLGQSKTIR